MNFSKQDHTFVICAYKESEFLEECIISLLNQTLKTGIVIATSTPNSHITSVSEKYNIPVFINNGIKGIGGDWNFALSVADTALVTIAHQDDIYEPEYTSKVLQLLNSADNPIIFFSGYGELRGNKKIYKNALLKTKRTMLMPLKFAPLRKSVFIRRRILSLGCPICCPSVTYVKSRIGENPFRNDYKSDLDWQQWEILSKKHGEFVYCPDPVMCHRIHGESATTEIIGNNERTKEDYDMYLKFWPPVIAKMLVKAYSKSQNSNEMKTKK